MLHGSRHEEKLYLHVLHEVENRVQHVLVGCLDIVVNVFEDEED